MEQTKGEFEMIETVFVIVMAFRDWDDCYNWAHANDTLRAEMVCREFRRERAMAPTISPRPRARKEAK